MKEDDALTFVCLFMLACMVLGVVLGEVDNYFHRRKIRNASRNKYALKLLADLRMRAHEMKS
ncbi:hypothetical protein VDG01_09680 [Xanthomonas campestris pv. raphani]|uniref:hypothetical protein n=1 Tax=Xanthomonas campestris TaxID=339 RepID=UPI002B224A7E|nr:hypothetical protein [Xanthomonas campestris]MEA9860386.1 hypothetical protein [Xanthomonas campestris pv. raphani]